MNVFKLCIVLAAIIVLIPTLTVVTTREEISPEFTTAEITIKQTEVEATKQTEPQIKSLGIYRLSAYCSCEICCEKWAKNRPTDKEGNTIVYGAAGEILTAGRSVAVDPSVIPFDTHLIINGKEYIAQDKGGRIKGKCIDVYFNNHEQAGLFGIQYAEVFCIK